MKNRCYGQTVSDCCDSPFMSSTLGVSRAGTSQSHRKLKSCTVHTNHPSSHPVAGDVPCFLWGCANNLYGNTTSELYRVLFTAKCVRKS
jgi:hypothetical protein